MQAVANRLELSVHLQIAAAVVLFFVWVSFPPPMFTGFAMATGIFYFLMVISVAVTSLVWLLLYSRSPSRETVTSGARYRMITSLVISSLALILSMAFVLLAVLANGLLSLI